MKKILLFLLPFISSCGHYKDGQSVWAEGGWLLLVVFFGGGAFSLFRYFKYKKSKFALVIGIVAIILGLIAVYVQNVGEK